MECWEQYTIHSTPYLSFRIASDRRFWWWATPRGGPSGGRSVDPVVDFLLVLNYLVHHYFGSRTTEYAGQLSTGDNWVRQTTEYKTTEYKTTEYGGQLSTAGNWVRQTTEYKGQLSTRDNWVRGTTEYEGQLSTLDTWNNMRPCIFFLSLSLSFLPLSYLSLHSLLSLSSQSPVSPLSLSLL